MTKSKRKKTNERDSLDTLYRKRDRALERLVAAFEKYEGPGDPEDNLNTAIDALALAQIAVTFEKIRGPHTW